MLQNQLMGSSVKSPLAKNTSQHQNLMNSSYNSLITLANNNGQMPNSSNPPPFQDKILNFFQQGSSISETNRARLNTENEQQIEKILQKSTSNPFSKPFFHQGLKKSESQIHLSKLSHYQLSNVKPLSNNSKQGSGDEDASERTSVFKSVQMKSKTGS